MDDRIPFAFVKLAQAPPHLVRNIGNFGDTLGQDIEIEAGATDQDRQLARASRRLDLDKRHVAPARRIAVIRRVEHAVKPVRSARYLLRAWPGSDDTEAVINLHAVRIDDDTVKFLCYGNGQRGFAAGGRPCKQDAAVLAAAIWLVFIHLGNVCRLPWLKLLSLHLLLIIQRARQFAISPWPRCGN